MTYADYEWYIKQDLSKYAGNWLAIIDKRIVSTNTDVKKLVKHIKSKHPAKNPLITKINNKLSIL